MTKTVKESSVEYGIDSRYKSSNVRKEESKALLKGRLERMEEIDPSILLRAKLLQLKLQMDDYLENPRCEDEKGFTVFLASYIDITYDKRNKFALDIGISSVKLSQVLNNHRNPQEEMIQRLMVHSESTFENVCEFDPMIWYKVYFQEKICKTILNQDTWKVTAKKHVKNRNLMSA